MCEPTTILTGVSAAASAGGQLAGASAENRAKANNYKRQLAIREIEWDRSRAEYATRATRAEEQLDENFLAASRGYGAEQQQLNALYDQASVSLQNDFIKLAEKGNYFGTGITADRLGARGMAELSRKRALIASNLVRGADSYRNDVANIRNRLKAANRKTLAPVQFQPIPGLPPVKPDMDMTGALLGAAGTLIGGGVDTYNQGKEMELWG